METLRSSDAASILIMHSSSSTTTIRRISGAIDMAENHAEGEDKSDASSILTIRAAPHSPTTTSTLIRPPLPSDIDRPISTISTATTDSFHTAASEWSEAEEDGPSTPQATYTYTPAAAPVREEDRTSFISAVLLEAEDDEDIPEPESEGSHSPVCESLASVSISEDEIELSSMTGPNLYSRAAVRAYPPSGTPRRSVSFLLPGQTPSKPSTPPLGPIRQVFSEKELALQVKNLKRRGAEKKFVVIQIPKLDGMPERVLDHMFKILDHCTATCLALTSKKLWSHYRTLAPGKLSLSHPSPHLSEPQLYLSDLLVTWHGPLYRLKTFPTSSILAYNNRDTPQFLSIAEYGKKSGGKDTEFSYRWYDFYLSQNIFASTLDPDQPSHIKLLIPSPFGLSAKDWEKKSREVMMAHAERLRRTGKTWTAWMKLWSPFYFFETVTYMKKLKVLQRFEGETGTGIQGWGKRCRRWVWFLVRGGGKDQWGVKPAEKEKLKKRKVVKRFGGMNEMYR